MSDYHNNSIFWVETSKINPNPFQPRREFNQAALEDLADSIRQYGVLQPLVVTRKEEHNENGGLSVYYELIAGERRLRASKIAHLEQVPIIIRKDTDNKIKLELAIIENLQREDLNPIDRALAFEQLYKEFDLTHAQIGKKMGKSRVYVSNSLRLLSLPEEIKQGLMAGKITEGHTRPLLMLSDKPEEQSTLFREINLKKLSVRDSEKIARSIAQDRVRKNKFKRDPRIRDYEKKLSENLGTRVQIEQKEKGGKITIDYFSVKDLESILASIKKIEHESGKTMMDIYEKEQEDVDSQKAISDAGPINFMTGEIKEFYEKGEQLEEEKIEKIIVEPENFEKQIEKDSLTISDSSENISLDEISQTSNPSKEDVDNFQQKKLPVYHHDINSEIVEYKKELPSYVHHENEELSTEMQFTQNDPLLENETQFVKSSLDEKQDSIFIQESVDSYEKIEEKVYSPEHGSYQQVQNNSGQVNYQNTAQQQGNQDAQHQVPQQEYYNQTQNVATQYGNQETPQQNYHYQQPKKKGFFGRMFS